MAEAHRTGPSDPRLARASTRSSSAKPGTGGRIGLSGSGRLNITEVYGPDSPAHNAGLRPGDILTDIDGQRVLLRANALNLIARLKPGNQVRIAGMRGNRRFEHTVTVVARPD